MSSARDHVVFVSFRQHGAVTPSDVTVLSFDGLYVGTGGDVAIRDWHGNSVTYPNVPGGSFIPVSGDQVLSTGTGASDIVWGLLD